MIFSKSLLTFLSIGLLSFFASSIKADDSDLSPSAKIATYFQKMDDAVQYLQQIQASADPSAPPDFSVAEKGLFKLGKAIDHATHKLKKLDGYLEDDAVASIDASLKDIAANVVTVTQTIKDSKDYSDSQGYTLPTVRVLQTVSAQIAQLFPELMAHLPEYAGPSIGYSISVWICSMADAIDYLDESSADPQTDSFCGLLPPDYSYIPTESDFDAIITFPQPWLDCNGSAMAMFYFGYTTGYIALPYSDPWCINGIYDYEFYDPWWPTDGEWYVSGSISISSNK